MALRAARPMSGSAGPSDARGSGPCDAGGPFGLPAARAAPPPSRHRQHRLLRRPDAPRPRAPEAHPRRFLRGGERQRVCRAARRGPAAAAPAAGGYCDAAPRGGRALLWRQREARPPARSDGDKGRAARLCGHARRCPAAHQGGGHAGTALYITPGDVTTGPGSLVAEVIEAAGFTPYRTRPGWGSLPIEAMVRRPPDLMFRAFFDSARYRQDYWTASRHPVVAEATRHARDVEVPGGWLSCGNWLTGHAVKALADARRDMR